MNHNSAEILYINAYAGEQLIPGITLTDMRQNESVNTQTESQSIGVSASGSWGTFSGTSGVTWTWTYQSILDTTTQSIAANNVTVYGPSSTLVIPYVPEVDVYQDATFGTFMFAYPAQPTGWTSVDPYQAAAIASAWPNGPSAFSYGNINSVYTVGEVITANVPSTNGPAISSYSVFPALPAGLILNTTTGIISGVPTVAVPVANYTVSASNAGGIANSVLTISVI